MAKASTVTGTYRAARIVRLRRLLAEKKIDALLVTNPVDVSYLTGFEGEDSFLIVTPHKIAMVSDFRYAEQIEREVEHLDALVMRKKGIVEETAILVKKLGLKTLGVQAENLTLKLKEALEKELKGIKLVATVDLVITLRHIKDAVEIGILEQAIAVAEHAFEALRYQIKPGMTEAHIANLLVFEMRQRGASGPSFETIVGVGANGSLPHYRPRQVEVENNTSLLIDWGARFAGYCSDLTRVVYLGNPPPKIKEIYQIVLDAQMAAIAAIKPGMDGKAVDKVARDIITKAGYGEQFGHGTGHGIGRDIHEPISFSKLSTTILKPGMVLTVEPGIYLPGIGGVRIEDDVLVTETGYRILTQLPKDVESTVLEPKRRQRHSVKMSST